MGRCSARKRPLGGVSSRSFRYNGDADHVGFEHWRAKVGRVRRGYRLRGRPSWSRRRPVPAPRCPRLRPWDVGRGALGMVRHARRGTGRGPAAVGGVVVLTDHYVAKVNRQRPVFL